MTASAGFRSRRQGNTATPHQQLQGAVAQSAVLPQRPPVIVKAFTAAPRRYRPRKASWAKSTVQLQQTALTITYPPKPSLVNAAVQAPPQWRRRPARWVKSVNQQEQADQQKLVMHAPAILIRAQPNSQRRRARVTYSPTPINASQSVIVAVVMYVRSVLSRAAPVARRKASFQSPPQRLQQALIQTQVTPIRSVLIPAQTNRLRRRPAWLRSSNQLAQSDQQARVGRSTPVFVRAKAHERRPARVNYSPTPINASQGVVVAVVMYMRSVLVRAPAAGKRRSASSQKNQAHLADAVLQAGVSPQKSIVSRPPGTTRGRPRARVIVRPIQALIAIAAAIIQAGGPGGGRQDFPGKWDAKWPGEDVFKSRTRRFGRFNDKHKGK